MSQSDERIAALEAQLATLESRLVETSTRPAAVDRRAMLRRGGAVLAGAAGVMALPGMTSGASAATNTAFTIGRPNDSGNDQSTLTSANPNGLATLQVSSTTRTSTNGSGGSTGTAGTSYGTAQLNLVPAVPYTDGGGTNSPTGGQVIGPFSQNPLTTATGDLFASTATQSGKTAIASDLVYTHSAQFTTSNGTQYPAVVGAVYTSAFHNVLVPVVNNSGGPNVRVLSTPSSSTVTIVAPVNGGSGTESQTNFGATGSVPKGVVVRVKFTPGQGFLTAGAAVYAVAANLTVASFVNEPGGNGYLTALATAKPSDTVAPGPPTSSVNFVTNGGIASNFAIIPVGVVTKTSGTQKVVDHYYFDLVNSAASAAMIVDVTGFFVSDTTDVVAIGQPGYSASSAMARAQRASTRG